MYVETVLKRDVVSCIINDLVNIPDPGSTYIMSQDLIFNLHLSLIKNIPLLIIQDMLLNWP